MANPQDGLRRGEVFRQRGVFLPPILTDFPPHPPPPPPLNPTPTSTQESLLHNDIDMEKETLYGLGIKFPEKYDVGVAQCKQLFNSRPLMNCLDEQYFVPGSFWECLDRQGTDAYLQDIMYKRLQSEVQQRVSYLEKSSWTHAHAREFWEGIRTALKDDDFEFQDWPPREAEIKDREESKTRAANTNTNPVLSALDKESPYRQEVRSYLVERKKRL